MRNDRGFTLIELLIVVAVIGVIAGDGHLGTAAGAHCGQRGLGDRHVAHNRVGAGRLQQRQQWLRGRPERAGDAVPRVNDGPWLSSDIDANGVEQERVYVRGRAPVPSRRCRAR